MADTPTLRVTLLGAGQEVGRSCCVLQYRGKTIVCDAGIHLSHTGMASLPFVDELDWSTVDAILITHFHLDHAGAITYIMEKTNFREGNGKVYMTHPTKAVYKFMMQDFLRMNSSSSDTFFTAVEVSQSLPSIIPVSAHQLITPCPGVSFTPYHAGHVLGACMYLIDITGLKILYTGDYSREEDRHLVKAEIPPIRPDVLIVESTYGVQNLEKREEKELRFTSLVHSIVRRGGHVLLPVFALGRAQELLLILDEYWTRHPNLHGVPIYYASSLARKCMAVYQTHIHTMNANIRSRFASRDNPFVFKHISSIPQQRGWERKIAQGPPCVVLASPGFMHAGPSRDLFELWAPDPRNGLIITGYSVEGTLARDILDDPEDIISLKSTPIPRRISVNYISFSAHVDYSQNSEFIELINAEHVVLVHGEQTAMRRLRAAMTARYKTRGVDLKIHTPRNIETLELSFLRDHIGRVIGTLAVNVPSEGDILSGLVVAKDHSYTLLDARDLHELPTSIVTQKQRITLGVSWELVRWHLEGMFGNIKDGRDKDRVKTIRVMDTVDVKHMVKHELTLEWESSASNDMIADATLAVITGIDKSPASVQLTSQLCSHAHPHADSRTELPSTRLQYIAWFLKAHFGEVELHMSGPSVQILREYDEGRNLSDAPVLVVHVDEEEVHVNPLTLVVTCVNETLRKRVESVFDMAVLTVSSLSDWSKKKLD
ncbi:Metallo-hydrolase/oxidoreductase [Gyrodon lividus]|nr:Metallo-hydrolase/oxidoreductase [Gyrodon lividus]